MTFDVFASIVAGTARTLTLYTNLDRLEAHLKELSPQDSRAAHKLCALTTRLSRLLLATGPGPGAHEAASTACAMIAGPRAFSRTLRPPAPSPWKMSARVVRRNLSWGPVHQNVFGGSLHACLALIMTLGP